MNECPECTGKLYSYDRGEWTVWVCWQCGHYESNTPAFKALPDLFKDMIRENPSCLTRSPTKNQQHFTTPDESTESKIALIAE